MSTHQKLLESGYTPQQKLQSRKIISTQEEGKKYVLNIPDDNESVVYQVDGYIIKNGEKCDKLILVKNTEYPETWIEIFLELKGRDVNHALTQIIQTAKSPIFYHQSNVCRRARVVARSFPSNNSNPYVERKKRELYSMGIDYRGLKPNQIDYL